MSTAALTDGKTWLLGAFYKDARLKTSRGHPSKDANAHAEQCNAFQQQGNTILLQEALLHEVQPGAGAVPGQE